MSDTDKYSLGELKQQLKTGTKKVLATRLKLWMVTKDNGLRTPSGDNPMLLKGAELKRQAAKLGISVMGDQDEIVELLVEKLKSGAAPKQAESSDVQAGASQRKRINGTALGTKVLELDEVGDSLGILNLAGSALSELSSVAAMRKSYLKLSLVLHPDKNRDFPDATKAFQALVRAFERLTKPEQYAEEETKTSKKAKSVARSNEGCKRTHVYCPRCKQEWNKKLDGNPDYYYNFMMMGLKNFTCSTCLFEFGAVTAIHKCWYCRKEFEYSVEDYHRKIQCGYCDKKFGFYMFHASDLVLRRLRDEVRAQQENYLKRIEQKRRRAESMRKRGLAGPSDVDDELAFTLGLLNNCPRCGVSLADLGNDAAEREHLRTCNDSTKIASHAQAKKRHEEKREASQKKLAMQADAQSRAAWQYLGGNTEQMWMLTDGAVQKEAEAAGIKSTRGKSKDELIAQLSEIRQSATLQLTDGVEGAAKRMSRKRQRATAASIPTNFHSMSFAQLKSVCVAHGITNANTVTHKAGLIKIIENDIYGSDDIKPLQIKGSSMNIHASAESAESSDEDDDDNDPLYIPKRKRVNLEESDSDSNVK